MAPSATHSTLNTTRAVISAWSPRVGIHRAIVARELEGESLAGGNPGAPAVCRAVHERRRCETRPERRCVLRVGRFRRRRVTAWPGHVPATGTAPGQPGSWHGRVWPAGSSTSPGSCSQCSQWGYITGSSSPIARPGRYRPARPAGRPVRWSGRRRRSPPTPGGPGRCCCRGSPGCRA